MANKEAFIGGSHCGYFMQDMHKDVYWFVTSDEHFHENSILRHFVDEWGAY